jgi:hypothetical protein
MRSRCGDYLESNLVCCCGPLQESKHLKLKALLKYAVPYHTTLAVPNFTKSRLSLDEATDGLVRQVVALDGK